jgi:protein-S-isoprenylcysteine O-methyltransferase Ste14
MTPQQAIYGLWDAWIVSWFIAALWSARTAVRGPRWSQIWRDTLWIGGAVILINFAAPYPGSSGLLATLWRPSIPAAWGLAALTAAGFAFCWWARLHLGRLWSGTTGRKADHHVVDTGPYRLVRHPIYSGILTALLAMTLLKGTGAAILGLALATLGLLLRARLEERFLRVELGPDAYHAYSRKTPMLLPFAPRLG